MKKTAKIKFSSKKLFSSEDFAGQEECSFGNLAGILWPKVRKSIIKKYDSSPKNFSKNVSVDL